MESLHWVEYMRRRRWCRQGNHTRINLGGATQVPWRTHTHTHTHNVEKALLLGRLRFYVYRESRINLFLFATYVVEPVAVCECQWLLLKLPMSIEAA
jgi:hypothetical protein